MGLGVVQMTLQCATTMFSTKGFVSKHAIFANEAFGNKHSCRMANLEVFVFVPDLLLSRRFAPGQKRKSGTKTKTSKFAMQQIYLPSRLALSRTR